MRSRQFRIIAASIVAVATSIAASTASAQVAVQPTLVLTGASPPGSLNYSAGALAFDNSNRVPEYGGHSQLGIFSIVTVGENPWVVYDFLSAPILAGDYVEMPALPSPCNGSCSIKQIATNHGADWAGGSGEDHLVTLDTNGWVSQFNYGGSGAGGATFSGGSWIHQGTQTTPFIGQVLASGVNGNYIFVTQQTSACPGAAGQLFQRDTGNGLWDAMQGPVDNGPICVTNMVSARSKPTPDGLNIFYVFDESGELWILSAGTNGSGNNGFLQGWGSRLNVTGECGPTNPALSNDVGMAAIDESFDGSAVTVVLAWDYKLWGVDFTGNPPYSFKHIPLSGSTPAQCTTPFGAVVFDPDSGNLYYTSSSNPDYSVCMIPTSNLSDANWNSWTCP